MRTIPISVLGNSLLLVSLAISTRAGWIGFPEEVEKVDEDVTIDEPYDLANIGWKSARIERGKTAHFNHRWKTEGLQGVSFLNCGEGNDAMIGSCHENVDFYECYTHDTDFRSCSNGHPYTANVIIV